MGRADRVQSKDQRKMMWKCKDGSGNREMERSSERR